MDKLLEQVVNSVEDTNRGICVTLKLIDGSIVIGTILTLAQYKSLPGESAQWMPAPESVENEGLICLSNVKAAYGEANSIELEAMCIRLSAVIAFATGEPKIKYTLPHSRTGGRS
jgi:hypothetical protein